MKTVKMLQKAATATEKTTETHMYKNKIWKEYVGTDEYKIVKKRI